MTTDTLGAAPENAASASDDALSQVSFRRQPSVSGIRLRSIAIGLILTVVGSFVEVLAWQFQPKGQPFIWQDSSLLEVAVFPLVVLVLTNRLLRRRWPTLAFSQSELVAIYGMVAAGAAFSHYHCMQFAIPFVLYPFHFASVEPHLLQIQQHIPAWLAPRASSVVEPYYSGGTSFFRREFLQAWLVPLVMWVLFAACLAMVMACLCILVRRQWMENEHLTFPSLQLPLALIQEEKRRIFAGRLALAGFALPLLLRALLFLRSIWPSIPAAPLFVNLGAYFHNPPWNALEPFPALVRPLHLGICYFIPLDVNFSAWSFYLLVKFLHVPGRVWGSDFPQWRQQAMGALMGLFIVLLWSGRKHFAHAMRAGFCLGSRRTTASDGEAWAARGLVLGLLALLLANWWAGMSLRAALLYLALFWALQVIMTRIRAQIGPPSLDVWMVEPGRMAVTLVGPRNFAPASLTLMSLYYWFTQTNFAQPMAHHLDTFRLARDTDARPLAIGKILVIGGVAGAFTCLMTFLVFGYHYGQDNFPGPAIRNAVPQWSFGQLSDLLASARGPDLAAMPGMGAGCGIVVALALLQRSIIGFPISPVGYALALSGALLWTWPSFVLMWIFKSILLRYMGLRLYRRLAPFFLGLILGDMASPLIFGLAEWGVASL